MLTLFQLSSLRKKKKKKKDSLAVQHESQGHVSMPGPITGPSLGYMLSSGSGTSHQVTRTQGLPAENVCYYREVEQDQIATSARNKTVEYNLSGVMIFELLILMP